MGRTKENDFGGFAITPPSTVYYRFSFWLFLARAANKRSRQRRERHNKGKLRLQVPDQFIVGGNEFAAFLFREGDVQTSVNARFVSPAMAKARGMRYGVER